MRARTWLTVLVVCLGGGCELVAGLGGEVPYPPDGGGTGGSGGSSCSDGEKDGSETDLDCGGSCPTPCGDGKGCAMPSDCASHVCTAHACATATCADLAKNGQETDTDCGGPTCPACADTKACAVFSDCVSRTCKAGACAEPYVWQKSYGAVTLGNMVADPGGNAVVAGSFSGSVSLGGTTLMSAGSTDVAVAKLDPTGKTIWSNNFGDAAPQVANAVAVDAASDVVVAGAFQGSINFGGVTLNSAGSDDMFLAMFGADGVHQWSTKYGDAQAQSAYGVAVDKKGDILVTGGFQGSLVFGPSTPTSAGGNDIFLAKVTPKVGAVWAHGFGDKGDQPYKNSAHVAVDGSNNVVLAVTAAGVLNFGGNDLASTAVVNVFVAKFDPSGKHLWSKHFGDGTSVQLVNGVTIDTAGNVLLAGSFQGTLDFGGNPLVSAGDNDVFVAKLDPSGNHVWSKRFGDYREQFGSAIAVDPAGAVAITGYFTATIDFGGVQLANVSGATMDIFVAKLDPSGNHLWSYGYGDAQDQWGYSIAAVGSDSTLVAGTFAGMLDFGGGAMTSGSGSDLFLAKLRLP